MRKIHVTEPTQEWWKSWRNKCADATADLIKSFNDCKEVHIDQDLYKVHKHKFLMHLSGPFRRKCAYCERDLNSQHGDVEHFRPKKGSTDYDDQPIRRTSDGVVQEHPGYFWLVYDWTNLLPSCQICNVGNRGMSSGGKPGKRNRFPVEDETLRDWEHNAASKEQPLLINPAIEDPSGHLSFESSGVIASRSERGRKTIAIFGLNEYGMPEDRAARYKDIKRRVKSIIQSRLAGHLDEEEELEVDRIKAGYGEFTTFALLAIEEASNEAIQLMQQAVARLKE